jgi:2-(1,2-epoxy-1,2-dihydrophenyl)acetyl-CoA isomerase
MTTPDPNPIVVSRRGEAVAVITLNRPDRLNALSHTLLETLRRTFRELDEDDTVRAIVITGAGRAFSAGADLQGDPSDAEDVVRRLYNPLIEDLLSARTPTVAAVNGVAAGAAVSLALACDLRVAAEGAYFQVSFTKVGLVPDAGLTWLLPRAVGSTRAAQMTLLAQRIDAPTAFAWGLVNETAEDALEGALVHAERLATLASTVGETRLLLSRSPSRTLAEQLDAEATTQGVVQHGADFQEVRRAYREKRKPDFSRSR